MPALLVTWQALWLVLAVLVAMFAPWSFGTGSPLAIKLRVIAAVIMIFFMLASHKAYQAITAPKAPKHRNHQAINYSPWPK